MKGLFKKFVSAAMCAISTFSCVLTPHVFANTNSNGFDFDLLEKVSKEDENALVSPLSLKLAMMMAANGAKGNTQKEILNVFGIENINDYNEKISQEFSTNSNLKIANSIWIKNDQNVDFSKEYKNKIKKYFHADADVFKTVDNINKWVKSKTNGKITDLLPKKLDDDKDFIAALVNAIYFNADWENPFSAEDTKKGDFHNADDTSETVDFMNKTSNFNYFGNKDFQLLEMKYKESDLSMYIILPKNGYKVTHEDFENALKNKKSALVKVRLPKFEFQSNLMSFVETLKDMGIKEAFEKNCEDFNTMFTTKFKLFGKSNSDTKHFYISDVLQKTFVKVDEKGTEAAAATAVIISRAMGCIMTPKPIPIYFNADHPFTYVIRNNKSGEIVFMGQQCKF